MAGSNFVSGATSFADKVLNGGLNSTAGPLALQNNESSDLLNIDFNKFGSIIKRNGYVNLNTTATSGTNLASDGLHWYELNTNGNYASFALKVSGGKLLKMDNLDGTWDDVTGAITITAGNHCDFENWLNEVYITNGVDVPFKWTGTGNASVMSTPPNLTTAKCVAQFSNYLMLANVTVSGTSYPTRIYYSNLNSSASWGGADWISVSTNDGQEIVGITPLSDRLVVFKTRSIYNVFYTGDADVPFILPGGGKSTSNVGTVANDSIQEVENGLVFLAPDGLYYYDGTGSSKLSDKVTSTLLSYSTSSFTKAVSCVSRLKNRYLLALPSTGSSNDVVLVWDFYNNAFSIYSGMVPSAMETFYVNGRDERLYFSDYSGYDYRLDTGSDDYPLKVRTAINGYFWSNWRTFEDLVDQKSVAGLTIFYQTSATTLTFSYSYDFETAAQYSQVFSLSGGLALWNAVVWDNFLWAGTGGKVIRRDLTGRGRVVRFGFSNNTLGETFQIDGFGTSARLETMA
jgi:hypothetical protein